MPLSTAAGAEPTAGPAGTAAAPPPPAAHPAAAPRPVVGPRPAGRARARGIAGRRRRQAWPGPAARLPREVPHRLHEAARRAPAAARSAAASGGGGGARRGIRQRGLQGPRGAAGAPRGFIGAAVAPPKRGPAPGSGRNDSPHGELRRSLVGQMCRSSCGCNCCVGGGSIDPYAHARGTQLSTNRGFGLVARDGGDARQATARTRRRGSRSARCSATRAPAWQQRRPPLPSVLGVQLALAGSSLRTFPPDQTPDPSRPGTVMGTLPFRAPDTGLKPPST